MGILFDQADALLQLERLDDAGIDTLDFGVIGIDRENIVCRYNAYESQATALAPEKALQHPFFTSVAQCMNNFLVAQRFEDAQANGTSLDATIDYLLTWRMQPTKVLLRLLASPEYPTRYILVQRL